MIRVHSVALQTALPLDIAWHEEGLVSSDKTSLMKRCVLTDRQDYEFPEPVVTTGDSDSCSADAFLPFVFYLLLMADG